VSETTNKQLRMNLTLNEERTKRLNKYVVNIVKKIGRVPPKLHVKIMYAALDEWMDHHENDLDIDWNHKE